MSVQTFMELSTKNHCAPAEQNGENVIRKSLSLLGVVLLPGLLIANAPPGYRVHDHATIQSVRRKPRRPGHGLRRCWRRFYS